jgi:hypothetical protein
MITDPSQKQIEEIGKNLNRIITKFLEIELMKDPDFEIVKANQELKDDLDIDLEKISLYGVAEIHTYLSDRKLTAKHIELIAEYVEAIAKLKLTTDENTAKAGFSKAIELLTVADDISQSLSLERMRKKKEMNAYL